MLLLHICFVYHAAGVWRQRFYHITATLLLNCNITAAIEKLFFMCYEIISTLFLVAIIVPYFYALFWVCFLILQLILSWIFKTVAVMSRCCNVGKPGTDTPAAERIQHLRTKKKYAIWLFFYSNFSNKKTVCKLVNMLHWKTFHNKTIEKVTFVLILTCCIKSIKFLELGYWRCFPVLRLWDEIVITIN